MFYLRCCLQPECVHPLCQQKQEDPNTYIPSTWYTGGPSVTYISLPVVDTNKPWGRPDCVECGGVCHGHYLKLADMDNCSYVGSLPPSVKNSSVFGQLKERQPS